MKRFSFFLLCFLALCLPVRAGGAEEQRECANILSAARLAPDAPLTEEGLALLLPWADLSAVPAQTRAGFCEILQRYLLDNDLYCHSPVPPMPPILTGRCPVTLRRNTFSGAGS